MRIHPVFFHLSLPVCSFYSVLPFSLPGMCVLLRSDTYPDHLCDIRSALLDPILPLKDQLNLMAGASRPTRPNPL